MRMKVDMAVRPFQSSSPLGGMISPFFSLSNPDGPSAFILLFLGGPYPFGIAVRVRLSRALSLILTRVVWATHRRLGFWSPKKGLPIRVRV